MDLLNEAKQVFNSEIEELIKVRDKIDNSIHDVLRELVETKGKVVVTGIGKSGIIGKKISATLASTGTESVFMNAAEGLHGDLGIIKKDDIVIAISNSGNTDEINLIVPVIKKIGCKIIALTGGKNSKLALESDYIIDIGVEKEACPMNLAPTSSTTATLVAGDMIATLLIKLKGFKQENFALYHPGGSLGRRLLLHVKDVMHPYDKLAIVKSTDDIDTVVMAMTEKKLGIVCVIDSDKINGIITEGDIRRALKRRDVFFSLKAEDIMTKKYFYVDVDCMAIEALEIMENRESQISVLPVMDKNNRLIGVVRIHDLIGKIK
ncbi:MAG: KpsF/GutQ family sugar-phosphate isomerase [Fusobacteria bacterium]|nr:KpsF/GutQ family sugar-phosphate isomerase [Fusobacteriota bacterium]